jgi:hypothetical protein
MKHLLLGFALLAFSWTATADDIDLYKVELIVFENLDPDAIHAELWPENPGTPPLDNAAELSAIIATPPAATAAPATPATAADKPGATDATLAPPAAEAAPTPPPPPPPPSWRWLNDLELSLNSQVQRLDDSQHYKTILHIGWIQPVESNDQGKSIHIYDGMEATRVDATAQVQTEATAIPLAHDGTAPATDASSPTAVPESESSADRVSQTPLDIGQTAPPPVDTVPAPAEAPHILDGTFTLRRGRFLHVDVDLGYTKTVSNEPSTPTNDVTTPADSAIPAAPQTTSYYVRMVQSRRIRNDKLNYLDHPLFGVLFLITPYQLPGNDESTQQ